MGRPMKRKNIDVRLGEAEKVAAMLGRANVGLVGPTPESEVVAVLRAIADAPNLPRTAEEVMRLVEGERAGWGQRRTPEDASVVAALARLVGAPVPGAFGSADQHAIAFAAWLAKSDRGLAGKREVSHA
jgi:hypothetical protein